MINQENTQKLEMYIKWGKWVVGIIALVIFLNTQFNEMKHIVELVKDNKVLIEMTSKKIEFTQDMIMTDFLYALKKQDEKLNGNLSDLKRSDIERDIKRCSLVKQNKEFYSDELETFCNRIKNIDFNKLNN